MGKIGSRAVAPTTAARTHFLLRRVFSHRTPRWHYQPFDRIILLWAKQTSAPKKGKQDMETKCGRFAEWLVTMIWRASASRTAGITATRWVGYGRETGENMLSSRFTAHDPNQTLRSPKGCRSHCLVRDSGAQPECLERRSGSCATSPLE